MGKHNVASSEEYQIHALKVRSLDGLNEAHTNHV
jgi:hypothetical protein